jgi:hypothetical protein
MGVVSEQRPARYQRSTNGLVAALLVTLLAIGGFVAFRALNRDQPDLRPEPVDYLSLVQEAQTGGQTLVYPAKLPEGWIATNVAYTPGRPPAWGISMLTDEGKYVGMRQQAAPTSDLLETYVDEDPAEGDEVQIPSPVGNRWRTWSDSGGDHAYSAKRGDETLLVFGSAPPEDLRTVVEALTTATR